MQDTVQRYPRVCNVNEAVEREQILGPIVHKASSFLVRAKDRGNGDIVVTVHRVVDGMEIMPHGWTVGFNRLTFDVRRAL